ncbi:MAG: PEP-CTERM sorting domain-containing protein [Phycisphaerae bacterium]|nr:PEP-CTERM sorting domain-containing protein [Phycisphaerae bacterium]
MFKTLTPISTLLLVAASNLAAAPIVVQPVAVGGRTYAEGQTVYFTSKFETAALTRSGAFSVTGLVEFPIAGLPAMTSAVMSAMPDLYWWGGDRPDVYNQGVYAMDLGFYGADGIIDGDDMTGHGLGSLPFAFYSVTFPSFLDVTQQYNEAVSRGYSFLGVAFDTHYATYDDEGSTARVFGPGGPAGDGILENNFALTLTPEPTTLLLLPLGGVAVRRRRR